MGFFSIFERANFPLTQMVMPGLLSPHFVLVISLANAQDSPIVVTDSGKVVILLQVYRVGRATAVVGVYYC